MSKEGDAPDLREAHLANKRITRTLKKFVEYLNTTPSTYSPVNPDVFDEWGVKSVAISETVPQVLADVVPMKPSRSAEVILAELESSSSPVIDKILELHRKVVEDEGWSHMFAARHVMDMLKNSYVQVFYADLADQILAREHASVDRGIVVSDELKDLAVGYQDLQERCETVEEVRQLNALLHSRPEIIESVLGIQVELCKALPVFLQTNPDLQGDTIAFSEVALWDDNTGEMTPSTRLLKLILHNWGRYCLEKPTASIDVMMRHAVRRALEDEIYHQNIFVFRGAPEEIKLYGIVSKVCPARLTVGQMVLHYLSE